MRSTMMITGTATSNFTANCCPTPFKDAFTTEGERKKRPSTQHSS